MLWTKLVNSYIILIADAAHSYCRILARVASGYFAVLAAVHVFLRSQLVFRGVLWMWRMVTTQSRQLFLRWSCGWRATCSLRPFILLATFELGWYVAQKFYSTIFSFISCSFVWRSQYFWFDKAVYNLVDSVLFGRYAMIFWWLIVLLVVCNCSFFSNFSRVWAEGSSEIITWEGGERSRSCVCKFFGLLGRIFVNVWLNADCYNRSGACS